MKQQVREISLEQLGEDLSENDDLVGLIIDEDKNNITWHDYGHHGKHLDFGPIADNVVKEFPGVEMERQGFWGQAVWNYIIVEGKWQQYTLWKFVAYTEGKGNEVLLDYKEVKDERTEEEKHDERDKMCREMAERLSQSQPQKEIAVYAYEYYQIYIDIKEFYRAKDGCATHQFVDAGLVEIMSCGYFDETVDWIESYGQLLLHPMEFAAELIRRIRSDEFDYPNVAPTMMLYGDTARYFSLIEPSDKKWLVELAEESDDACAIYCLLHGMNHKYRYWNETFVDENTKEEMTIPRYELIDGSTFEKNEGEEERLIQKVLDPFMIINLSVEKLTKLCQEIHDNKNLLLERIRKGDEEAAMDIDDPSILQELCEKGNKYAAEHIAYKYAYGDEENGIFIDHAKAEDYMKLAGQDYNPEDYEEEPRPCEFEYTLHGKASMLNDIRAMINELCQCFGTPDNEMGMFVPLGPVMEKLVGSPYYQGNILHMNQETPDSLTIHAEANSGAPLLYALLKAFPNLDVEVKKAEYN